MDKGTETVMMTTMHCYLQQKLNNTDDATETVLFGPSTQNKIERWWRELLERLERYFKDQLNELLEAGDYDPSDETDRYGMLPNITCGNFLKYRLSFSEQITLFTFSLP